MAVTKVLARKGRLDVGIHYVLNGDKTNEQILTAYLNCDPGHACRQMLDTKRAMGKTDGVQYYHIIQSFKPGEVTPELALEIAREFAAEHLPGYQAVIGVHVDKEHIHAHTIFNSVNADTGEKYHSNARSYYSQIRAISDRLCREHGLSVIMEGKADKAVSYIEWLRQSRGQPTFRAMLEADLREAIEDANDIGHFFLIMEHKGYEIKHGNRLGFRLRGQDRFMVPGRKTRCSPRTASAPPLEGIWMPLPQVRAPPSSTGRGTSRTAGIPSTPDSWPCMSITSICWARPGSGSTRRG
ncbi:relaxase/mobilization nuclease domain-containing protein [Flavonifractor plautii]|nr:relaxase/mobilization nuclease domain-containing protein [Flavonifractor plautii]